MTSPVDGTAALRLPAAVHALPAGHRDELAVFDADGTLWQSDLADDFTAWLIARGELDGTRFVAYQEHYRKDPVSGCSLLLTLYAGQPFDAIERASRQYWHEVPDRRWIPEVVATVELAHQRGYRTVVVSGSPSLVLQHVQKHLPVDDVLAMDFEVDHRGQITGNVLGTPSAGPGKLAKLRERFGERPIRLCCGDSVLDEQMMTAADLAWAIHPHAAFRATCQARGWLILG